MIEKIGFGSYLKKGKVGLGYTTVVESTGKRSNKVEQKGYGDPGRRVTEGRSTGQSIMRTLRRHPYTVSCV